MNDLVIGGMPQERRTLNLGEYAEEAVLITEEQPAKQKRPLFIEANTVDVTMEHLKNDCIIPVFAKDNEATLSLSNNWLAGLCMASGILPLITWDTLISGSPIFSP